MSNPASAGTLSAGGAGATAADSFPIYWEKQESALCGTHAINNLLQGPFYTEIGMAEIAHSIDARERQLMLENGAESASYLSFLAQDSSNVDESGNFSLEVLKEALQNFGLECVNIQSPECKEQKAHPLDQTAYLCNLQSHWLAIRKINNLWFNLNSLQTDNDGWGPTLVSDFYLESYLHTLLSKNYSIFIVEGAFPPVDTDVDVQGRGRWFDSRGVIEYTRFPARRPKLPKAQLPAGTPQYGPQADLARAIAASMQGTLTGGSTVWRGPTYRGGGGTSGGNAQAGDEDEDLRRALAASMEDVHPPAASASAATAAASNAASPFPAAPAAAAGTSNSQPAAVKPFVNPAGDPCAVGDGRGGREPHSTAPVILPAASIAVPSNSAACTAAAQPSPEMIEAAMQVLAAVATSGFIPPTANAASPANVAAPSTTVGTASGLNAGTAIDIDDEDEEAQMRRAIEMSMQE